MRVIYKQLFCSILAISFASPILADNQQKAEGLWQGTFDINGSGSFDFTGLYVGGEMVAVSKDAKVVYQGNYSVEGDEYTSSLTLYQLDGSPFDMANLQGGITGEPPVIETKFLTLNGQDSGSLQMKYSPVYEMNSSADIVQGQWGMVDAEFRLDMNINDQGGMEGTDSEGCVYKGEIRSIDPEFNAYRVNALVSSCGSVDGEYQGMAYSGAGNKTGSGLNIYLLGENYGFYFPMSDLGNDVSKLSATEAGSVFR